MHMSLSACLGFCILICPSSVSQTSSLLCCACQLYVASVYKKQSPSLRSAKSGVSARLFEKFVAVFVPPFFGSNPGAEEDQEEQAKEAAGSRRASFLQAWRFLGT